MVTGYSDQDATIHLEIKGTILKLNVWQIRKKFVKNFVKKNSSKNSPKNLLRSFVRPASGRQA